ncbi:NAD(P)-dependent alcohol dehydrogenase [Fictibacillus sp. 18YEL24]|uniref:NAD(P)-dependent alcohol dehydrogenase n=1 Tax=Fictibacillus sp. 18YEL24 TaxID=2745875 RepID=UPI0018CCBE71|nr:NAD(P)-dependent alcohol dehydrogenase [Fictibacillus sp. 18YEL24]MBH0168077.1 NAD(P)-dependent alcohol dehydrogenase [Fictibacillus sp. 18YEL24]
MKAVLCTKYGSPQVLILQQVPKPAPKENDVLIKIHATTVTTGDVRVRGFNSPLLYWLPMRLFLGIRRPRKPILGVELAGVVEEVGQRVSRFKKGDHVYAMTGMRFGAHAEYICLPEDGIVAHKPQNVTFEEAAAIPFGGTTALHFLRKGKIESGQNVLIYGASGAVGSAAVQLAKFFDTEVTAVCGPTNSELVKSLGADHVVDYTKEDYTKSEKKYDIIFDAVGKTSTSKSHNALTAKGKFVTVDGQGIAKERTEDLEFLKERIESGQMKPVIDRYYMLDQISEAHEYVETGRKKGNVVIRVV